MSLLNILLQSTPTPQGAMGGYQNIILMVLIFVVFYFFMIRPQSKRQKEIRKFQDSLTPGQSVITSGGIYGKVKDVKDNMVIIEIADNVRIKVNKSMVYDSPEDAQPAAK